jgi:hypothetical protein
MSFLELDQRIRSAMPDGPERRDILVGLHDLEEGANQTLGWLLSVSNYKLDEEGVSWTQQASTRFQVNDTKGTTF